MNLSLKETFENNESFHYNLTFISAASNKTGDPYEVPPGVIFLLSLLYGIISLLAVIGNGIVILVIVKNRKMQTVTNIFIANLAVADVVIGMFSVPFQFQAALLQRWVIAHFMCALAPFVQVISVNVSIFTLSVIACDRYIAVLHPFKAGCSKKSAAIIISVIWWVAITTAIPMVLYFRVRYNMENIKQCGPLWPTFWEEFPQFYSLVLVFIQYILPLVVISFCYFRIACHIWGARAPGCNMNTEDVRTRNKKKVVKMMIIVVCSFVLCWLPLQVYNLLNVLYPAINLDLSDYKAFLLYSYGTRYHYINIIWLSSNWFAMSNSCYNPFIYGLCNEKFKREFRILFSMCPCKCVQPENKEYIDYSEDGNHTYRRCSVTRNITVRYNFANNGSRRFFRNPTDATETSQI